MKTAYLGPKGTFSEQAALKICDESDIVPCHTIWEVLDSVNSGKIESGIVPIENSIEGTVNITMDTLIFDTKLFIQKQIIIPIEQNLIAKKSTNKNDIKKILSHPQGIAQCRKYLQLNYPNVETISTTSTSEAVKIVSMTDEPWAAIGIEHCAEIYGLNIISKEIQDSNNNFTQFIVVSKNDTSMPALNKKTSIAFSTLNEPGQLYRLLDILAIWDLNMTKIVSRPMKNKAGEYVFFVDIDGNNNEKDIIDAITMIKRKTSFFKNLGSYSCIDCRLQN